jgi:drug/metabolite transporter (DMT)-like permease
MSVHTPTESSRPDGFALTIFVMLVLVWGLLWPAMKVATDEIPILTFRAAGSLMAVIAMLIITVIAGHSLKVPKGKMALLAIGGLFNVGAWLYLSAVGVTMIGAGRASLIAYTMPVWAFLMGIPLLGERATMWRLTGLALAMGGLAILIGEDISAVNRTPTGVLVMIGASWCFAFGTVWQKRTDYEMPHLSVLTWQLGWGAAPIVILALPELPTLEPVSWKAIGATVYAGLIAQVFGVGAYLWLVKRLPVKTASLSVLLVPVVGLSSSAILLDERLGWTEVAAAALIFAAIGTAFPKEKNG